MPEKISNNFIANHLKDIQFVDSSVTGMFERCGDDWPLGPSLSKASADVATKVAIL